MEEKSLLERQHERLGRPDFQAEFSAYLATDPKTKNTWTGEIGSTEQVSFQIGSNYFATGKVDSHWGKSGAVVTVQLDNVYKCDMDGTEIDFDSTLEDWLLKRIFVYE